MNVRVIVFVILAQALDDHTGFLGGRGIVKIDQRLAVDLLGENGKVVAQNRPIYSLGPILWDGRFSDQMKRSRFSVFGLRISITSALIAACPLR